MKNLIFLVFATALFCACEKEIKLKPEEVQPRIVVNGILSAGDTIHIQISESRDVLYAGQLPLITNAQAWLYDENDNAIAHFTEDSIGYYSVYSVLPQPNNVYKLKVAASGFESISSSTIVPKVIDNFTVDTMRTGDKMNFTIHFNDHPDETNFYALTIFQNVYNCNDFSCSSSLNAGMCTKELEVTNVQHNLNGDKCASVFLFSDENFNGSEFTFSTEQDILTSYDSINFTITLRSITEEYYKYKLTNEAYNEVQPDPFSQPVQVYSNIENGFGIFGGARVYSETSFWK